LDWNIYFSFDPRDRGFSRISNVKHHVLQIIFELRKNSSCPSRSLFRCFLSIYFKFGSHSWICLDFQSMVINIPELSSCTQFDSLLPSSPRLGKWKILEELSIVWEVSITLIAKIDFSTFVTDTLPFDCATISFQIWPKI
jgi:hypothetical protein